MKHAVKVGFSFGLTSGIITTLGLMVGLWAGTQSTNIVLAGIMTIAVADAFSDALGIHISEESEKKHTSKQIWQSTMVTFTTKFFIAMSFVVPILFLPLQVAIGVNIAYGLTLLGVFSYHIAHKRNLKHLETMLEHLAIAVLVIFVTNLFGTVVRTMLA